MNDYNISNYEKYLIKNKKEKQAESKENILEEQVSKEPKVIGIKKK